MDRLGMEEGEAIEHSLLTRAIENAQKKVESNNFSVRKQLLEYDDVMNKQREVIYARRREILSDEDIGQDIMEMIEEKVDEIIMTYTDEKGYLEDWDTIGIAETVMRSFSISIGPSDPALSEMNQDEFADWLLDKVVSTYKTKEENIGPPLMRRLEKIIMLRVLDAAWQDHLEAMDQLKEGIGLRAYGQRNPLIEYQKEGYNLFLEMGENVKGDVLAQLFRVQIARDDTARAQAERDRLTLIHREFTPSPMGEGPEGGGPPGFRQGPERPSGEKAKPVVREAPKVGRNDPCPCGSGKKYKKCHGKVEAYG
jgi:preprotein translocase subunit SecA